MKKTIQYEIEEFDSINELSEGDQKLLNEAAKACEKAYAPYSEYNVGAALLLDNGKIITGNNQENVAYPSGLCAERVAMFYASSQYPDAKILTIAITARSHNFTISQPVTPCGSCRQVMAEYENRQQQAVRVILSGETGKIQLINNVDTLLPLAFHAAELKKQ